MSNSYQAKDSLVLGRQLAVQEVAIAADLTTGLCDAAGIVAINNGTLTATTITLSVGEVVSKASLCEVRNRATGAIVATAAAPDVSVAQKITLTCNGTGITDCVIFFRYIVAE